jgi:hypothetical protein
MYIQVVPMSSCIVTIIVDYSLANVCSCFADGAGDGDCLKDLSACKDGVCSLLIDVECSDLGSSLRPPDAILRRKRVKAA